MTLASQLSVERTTIEALSVQSGEPDWTKQIRMNAFEQFEHLPLPTQDEAWRNMRLRELNLTDLAFHVENPSMDVPESIKSRIEASSAGIFVQRNHVVVEAQLKEEWKAKGVVLTSLEDAIQNHAQLVQPYLTKLYQSEENKFAALHYALRRGGAFLYIPKNVEVTDWFQLFTYIDERNTAVFDHTLIVADQFSKVTILEHESSSGNSGRSLRSASVEIIALDGAKVTFVSLQNFGSDVYNLNIRRADSRRDADVKWSISEMGAALSRSENSSYVTGDGGNSDSVVVFFASGEQFLDISAAMVHTSKHGTSDIVAKGVMTDQAKTIWRGLGHIKRGAVGSQTFQRENSLILSDDAKGDAIPGLLIQETEVAGAGHAATVGKIDELHLFYLMSRGIQQEKAIQMIVEGFFAGVIEQIPIDNIRNEVQEIVNRKLGL